MNQNQNMNQPPVKKRGLSVAAIILIIIAIITFPIIIMGILAAVSLSSLGGARDKAHDARIMSDVSQTRVSAEQYFDQNNYTYVGFTGNPELNADAENYGSKIIIQGLSAETYLIYAKLPSSNKIYCADSTGVAIQLDSIATSQKSCQ